MLTLEILLILVCMSLNAFFSGMETGMISIHRLRLQHLVRTGNRHAALAESFLKHPSNLLSTTLVGTNLCVSVVSTLTASLALRHGGQPAQVAAGATMGILVLVFCEFIPKSWFHGRPIERCLPLAPLLQAAYRILRPIGAIVTTLTQWIEYGKQPYDLSRSPYLTREHMRHLARDSARWGHLSGLERLMIDRVLQMEMKTVRQIMTPIDRLIAVRATDPVATFFDQVRCHNHMRLPVRDANNTVFVGVVSIFNVIEQNADAERDTVAAFMRPPFFVADTLRADEVLPLMRRHRQPMALVQDCERHVVGLITTEDVLTQVMGRIPDDAHSLRQSGNGNATVSDNGKSPPSGA